MDHKEQVIGLFGIPNPSIFELFWAHHAGREALDALYGSTSDVIPTPLWHTLDLPLSWMVSTNVGHTAKVFFSVWKGLEPNSNPTSMPIDVWHHIRTGTSWPPF